VVGKPEVQKVVAVDPTFAAGEEAGRGCTTLLLSGPVSLVVFVVAWIFGGTYLAVKTGVYVEGQREAPLWLGFAIFVLPVILAWVLRRPIRRVVPVLMGSALMIVFTIVMFFVLLMGVSMIHNLLFDWPGAH